MRTPIVVMAAALVGAAPAVGQSASPSASAAESRILALLDSAAAAWNRGDVEGHLAINADSVWYMTKAGPSVGNAKVADIFRQKYFPNGKPIQTLRFDHVSTRPLGERFALVVGQFILTGGSRPEVSGWFTTVWERRREGWRVIHDHSG